IALDNVEQLGSFIELELLVSDESEIAVAQSILDDLANRVGLSSTDRRGYLDMLLEIDS
ncbi:MAG TPA: class IV adenylate cyclase, partial [Planctomycetaceae bacterium]|nr:class IV adenylate cyclase [Planctomycetaceae bacterium]